MLQMEILITIKGTALAGISGLLSPFLLRGGRAGFSEAKSLFDIIKEHTIKALGHIVKQIGLLSNV